MNTWRETPVCASADRIAAALLGAIERQDHHIGVIIAVRWASRTGDMTRGHSSRRAGRRPLARGSRMARVCRMILPPRLSRHCAWRNTGAKVRARITMSSHSDQLSMYSRSDFDAAEQLLLGLGLAAPAADLGEAGQTRAHAMARRVVRRDHLERLAAGARARSMRPWPDQRHVAAQHVEELRQFIERCAPQEGAHTCHPLVVARCLRQPAWFRCVVAHRAELPHLEADIGEADAALAEQDGAAGFPAG